MPATSRTDPQNGKSVDSMMEARHMTSALEGKTVSASYLPSLDGIRACAFLLVFFAHAGSTKSCPVDLA